MRSSGSMKPNVDRQFARDRPSVERLDTGVASEYRTPAHVSYGEHAPAVRDTSRGINVLPAVVLTLLAVIHLVLLCFYNKRLSRWPDMTVRWLAQDGNRACQLSSDSGDGKERGGWPTEHSDESFEQPPLGAGEHLEEHTSPLIRLAQSASIEGEGSDGWWNGGHGNPYVQPIGVEVAGAHSPSYRAGDWSQAIWVTQGAFEHSTPSSQLNDAFSRMEAYEGWQIPPLARPAHSASVEGQAPDDWWTGYIEGPFVHAFREERAGMHLPAYAEGNWPQWIWPTQGTSEHGASSIQATLVKGKSITALYRKLPRHLHAGEGEAGGGGEAGLDCRLVPAAVKQGIARFFSQLVDTVSKCSSLLPKLGSERGRRLTWMLLRLATLDMAALARVPRDVQAIRRQLGDAIHDLALELLLYSQSTGYSSAAFIQQLQTFAQLIRDIQCTWGATMSLPPEKNVKQMQANLAVSKAALKHYGAVLEGLLWLTEAFPVHQIEPLVEQQLRVLEALCAIRAVQVCRETASRQLIFYYQTLRQSRPLVDVGFMTSEDKSLRSVTITCLELDRTVAGAGGIFAPPQESHVFAATPPQAVSNHPRGQDAEELHGASSPEEKLRSSSQEHLKRASLGETTPQMQGENLSMFERGTASRASASVHETEAERTIQKIQPRTPSESLPPSESTRRWSRLRHRSTLAKPTPREAPLLRDLNP